MNKKQHMERHNLNLKDILIREQDELINKLMNDTVRLEKNKREMTFIFVFVFVFLSFTLFMVM